MAIPPELMPVIQITLPVVAAIFGASWIQNKRIDDLVARVTAIEVRLGEILGRLGSIDARLANLEQRTTRLEERIPPLVHR